MTKRLASQISDYGGAFMDKEGVLNVYLTDLSSAATARPIVQMELNHTGRPNVPVRFVKSQYRYRYLDSLATLLGPILSSGGVSCWGVDDRRNRLLICVPTDQDRERIIKAITAAKLPLAAIIVEKQPYATTT
jgi:hypothetical protein